MRKLAYEFGKQLRPDQGAFESLHEALDLNGFGGTCKTDAVAPTEADLAGHQDFGAVRTDTTIPEGALFVSPDGDDSADGTRDAPLQSIQLACDRAALLVAQDSDVVASSLMKLFAGTSRYELNTKAFVEQSLEYEKQLETANPLVRMSIQQQQRTHPLPVKRVAELEQWFRSDDYQRIVSPAGNNTK